MKMETPIKSPVKGVISGMSVSQGDKVHTGQIMAKIG